MSTMAEIYVGKTFSSWEEAESSLDKYADENYFAWSIFKSSSVVSENKKLAAMGRTDLYNSNLKHKFVILTCVFGGLKRIGQGKGVRPIQSTWKQDCPVLVHLTATRESLVVKEFVKAEHTHDCNAVVYSTIPKIRRRKLHNQEVASTVTTLLQANVKPSTIRSVLRPLGCGQVSQRDLSNFRQKWKKGKLGNLSPEEKLMETLGKLLDIDPSAYIDIGKTEQDELSHLFIQTSAMRRNMEKFGKVLLLDHTYKINKNRMPVSVMMTMDGHGEGRSVGYAFIANEKSSTIGDVMSAFRKSIGEEVSAKIKTVIIDKDYSEVKAINEVFGHVSIQLCDFHVSRTFLQRTLKEDKRVFDLLHDLRFCCSDQKFSSIVEDVKCIASADFFSYFEDNWVACPIAWSYRDKKKSINLGNRTNNRLEIHNAKIKMMLNSDNELYEAVDALLEIVQNKEEDCVFRNIMESVKETYITKCSDPVANEVLRDLTRFSAKLLLWELSQTVSDDEIEEFQSSETSCTCPHWFSYLLPCRHIFQCRRKMGVPPYVKTDIDTMWLKEVNTNIPECETPHSFYQPQVSLSKVRSGELPKNSEDRYNQALIKAKYLCAILSECGTSQFSERYAVFQQVADIWCRGSEVAVLEIVKDVQSVPTRISEEDNVTIDITPSSSEDLCPSLGDGVAKVSHPSKVNNLDTTGVSASNIARCGVSSSDSSTCIMTTSNVPDFGMKASSSGASLGFTAVNVATTGAVGSFSATAPTSATSTLPLVVNTSKDVSPRSFDGSIAPNCFCRVPSIRLVASQQSRIAGRPFFKCANSKCKFWRLAKRETNPAPTPVPHQKESYRNLLDDDSENNLLVLVDLLATEGNDQNQEKPLQKPLKEVVSLDEQEQEKPLQEPLKEVVSFDEQERILLEEQEECGRLGDGNISDPAVSRDILKNIFRDIKLPPSVKHKGRPRGLGKTVARHGWSSTKDKQSKGAPVAVGVCETKKILTKKPRGVLFSRSDAKHAKDREDRAKDIPDDNVVKASGFWHVKSQSKNENTFYKVVTLAGCTCITKSIKECLLNFRCSCRDYDIWKCPCKHIYKVHSIFNTQDSPTPECIACQNGHNPEGGHSCIKCFKNVHALDTCSKSIDPDREGYGEKRICVQCLKVGSINPNEKRPNEDSDSGRTRKPKKLKTKELETVHEEAEIPFSQDQSSHCDVCSKAIDSRDSRCTVCGKKVHVDTLCSLPDPCGIKDGAADESVRVCRLCICKVCKMPRRSSHSCKCVVCAKSTIDLQSCINCLQAVHTVCASIISSDSLLCNKCISNQGLGCSTPDLQILLSDAMLPDNLISKALEILRAQFPKIMGLASPITGERYLTRWPLKGEEHNTYVPCQKESPYIQIINTGGQHWITCFKRQGAENEIHVLNSSGANDIGSFVEQQLALIMNTDCPHFTVIYSSVKLQHDGVNECGPLAVAFATELAFIGKVTFVDFELPKLRRHILQCILAKKFTPFPRTEEVIPTKKLKEELVDVFCTCRLPGHFDSNMLMCSKCRNWCHYRCHGVSAKPTARRWICTTCSK